MQTDTSRRNGAAGGKMMVASLLVCLAAGVIAGCSPARSVPAVTPAFDPSLPVDEMPVDAAPLRFDDLAPVAPQPDAGALRDGLAAVYFYEFFKRNVGDLPAPGSVRGSPGEPIPMLNHQFGDGPVFDSDAQRGVGMRMTGYVALRQPGTYHFRALSNDGVRIYLGNRSIIEDPDVHADRLSIPAIVSVKQTGWYSLRVDYFQRKGTAALGLFWRRPGDDAYRPVPPSAYAHIPDPNQQ